MNSRQRLNFTSGTIIFYHSPYEQSIFVYLTLYAWLFCCLTNFFISLLDVILSYFLKHLMLLYMWGGMAKPGRTGRRSKLDVLAIDKSLWNSLSTAVYFISVGHSWYGYSLIAFDERVTFWFHRVRPLPCACAYVALFARRLVCNHYAIAHVINAVNAQAQGSDRGRWSQKVTLSSKAIVV